MKKKTVTIKVSNKEKLEVIETNLTDKTRRILSLKLGEELVYLANKYQRDQLTKQNM